ncbi:MAG: hypothetical protein LBT68_01375 [Spirochaetales bacterium]|jgi:predicted RNase H-like nuclease (RuvC/YqgF family)|nr:hypothetical protein [Spirochaetales bacterium]
MDDKQKLISELDGRIDANQAALAGYYAALGKYASKEGRDALPEGNIRTLLNQITEFQSSIEDAARAGKRILEIVERLEDIRRSVRFLETEAEQLEKENLPAYEEFGKISADSYEGKSLPREAQEIAAEIQSLRKEAADTDEKVSNLKESAKGKPFLSKVFESGKAMILNSSKSFKLRNLGKLYQNFGRILLRSLDEIPSDAYLNIYRENRRKIEGNAEKTKNLTTEENELDRELRSLGVEKRFQKRLKDLEIQSEKNSCRLDELLKLAGQELYEKHKDFSSGRAADIAGDIQTCLNRAAEYAEEKKKLEAAIEYDNLTRKIHDLREELESEENAVSAHRTNAENLKTAIEETEKERGRVEKLSREGEKRQENGGNSESNQ